MIMELIDKTKLLVEIKRRILEDYNTGDKEKDAVAQGAIASLKYYIEDTLEVKEVNTATTEQLIEAAKTVVRERHEYRPMSIYLLEEALESLGEKWEE